MEETFVKLYSRFLQWEWYDDVNTKIVFLHLLLKAETKDTRWHGIEVKRGQVVTSIRKLAKELHLTEREVRTSLAHLNATHETTRETTHQITIITICKYDSYNGKEILNDTATDTLNDTATTQHRHTIDTPQKTQSQRDREVLGEVDNTASDFSELKRERTKENNTPNSLNIYNNIIEKEKEKEKPKVKTQADKEAELAKRQKSFYESLIPYLEEYGKEMLREFYDYWSEPNKSRTRMLMELERTWDLPRRLKRWSKTDYKKRYGTENIKAANAKRAMEVTATQDSDFTPL